MDDPNKELQDAAQRMADAVNLHVAANKWIFRDRPGFIAIELDSGSSIDGVLYDSRAEATRHTRNKTGVCYIQVKHDTMSLREAIVVLAMNRKAYKMGVVFTEEEVVVPQLPELMRPFIPNTLKKVF